MKKKSRSVLLISALFLSASLLFAAGNQEETKDAVPSKSFKDGITVAAHKGYQSEYPQQFELKEFEQVTGKSLAFKSNPIFSSMESVEQRLPDEPLVAMPYESIGQYGGTYRGLSRAPESGTSGVLSSRHVNLVRMSDDLKTIVPNIARDWEWNSDFTEITFRLRKGHKWSDGQPFTAEDIDFWWNDIKMNKDLNPKVRERWKFGGEPMTVKVVDETTVKFSFAVPSPGFILTFATLYIQPFQPKHALMEFHAKYNPEADKNARDMGFPDWQTRFNVYYHDWKDSYHPLSGKAPRNIPTLESHILYEETTEYRKLKANPYFHIVDTEGNQLPYIDEIYEVFIQDEEVANLKVVNGEIDYKAQGMELRNFPLFKENEATGNYHIQMAPIGTAGMVNFSFNMTHPDPELSRIYSDIRFKEAMSLALNRSEINEVVFLGQGDPQQLAGFDPQTVDFVDGEMQSYMTEFNPKKADDLLDQVGLERGSDGFRNRQDGDDLILLLQFTTQGAPPEMMSLVKEYWENIGIKCELKEVNSDLYWSLLRGYEHDVAIWHANGTTPPGVYSRASVVPPFNDDYMGNDWATWFLTNGKEGQEPGEDIKELWALFQDYKMAEFGSGEYRELGKKIAEIHNKKLFRIGTVGNVPRPVIVSNRLMNVPEISYSASDYYYNYPFRPYQWFFTD